MNGLNIRLSHILLVIFVSSFFLLANLNLSPVFQVSEGREGVVVQEMIRSSNYILPLRHGEIVPSKPVLFHLLSLAPYKLFTANSPFALRFVSALAAIASCLILYLLACSIAGYIAGLFSVGFLLSTYGFVHLARDGRVDMLFNFFMLAAICLWLRAAYLVRSFRGSPSEISNWIYFFFSLFAGLAMLVKGPLGVILPVCIILAISLYEWGIEGVLSCIRGVLVFAILIPLPWYLLASLEGGGDFLLKQIIFENLSRFTGGKGVNTKPIWFYCVQFWSLLAPWSFLFLLSFFFKKSSDSNREFAIKASLVWVFVVFLFLTISSGKRRAYLLSLIPGVSLYLGLFISQLYEEFDFNKFQARFSVLKIFTFIWYLVLFVSLTFLIIISFANNFLPYVENHELYSTLIAGHQLFVKSKFQLLFVFMTLAVSSFVALRDVKRNKKKESLALSVFLTVQFALFFLGSGLLAVKGYSHSYEQFAKDVNDHLGNKQKVSFIKSKKDESFDAFFFYINRDVTIVDIQQKPDNVRDYYLIRASNSGRERKDKIVLRGGRLIDQKEEQLLLLKRSPVN